MNWGKGIVLSFVLFALFIGVLVTICVRQDVSLVATDYYKQELDYQQQIDRSVNTDQLEIKPEISIVNNSLQVYYRNFSAVQTGELKLFRPSNAASDMVFEIKATPDTLQVFDLSAQQEGMYKARLKWSMNDKEYYLEEVVYL